MYMTRENENNYEFIHFFRSGTGGFRSGTGRRGEGGEQMWTVVNKKLMHSIFS